MIADQTSPYEPPTTRDRDSSQRLTVWSFGSVLVLAITMATYILVWGKLKEVAIGLGMPDPNLEPEMLMFFGWMLLLQRFPIAAALVVVAAVSFAAVFTRGSSKDRTVAVCTLLPIALGPIAALFGPMIFNHI